MRLDLTVPILLFLAADACEHRPLSLSYDVTIDPSFAPADIETALPAPDAWTAAIPELSLHVTVGPCVGERSICVVPATGRQTLAGFTTEDPHGGAVCYISVDEIRLRAPNAATADRWIEWTVEHEIGHGLTDGAHLHDGTRMALDVENESPGLTVDDVAHFWSVR